MKSKVIQRLLRGLITVLGAGVGAAMAALTLQLYGINNPESHLSVGNLVLTYVISCVIFAILLFFLSDPIIRKCTELGNELEQRLDKMSISQMTGCMLGLVVGLVIAALLSQLVGFLGQSMFTTALSAILYVTLGATGWSIGWKRGKDFLALFTKEGFKRRHRANDSTDVADDGEETMTAALPKLLDTSAIIDGRILDVCRTGFVEGKMIVPQFVLDEMRHVADTTDELRRSRGRRGLDILKKMQAEPKITLQVDATDWTDTAEVDVKLLRLAKQLGGVIITGDYNLNKVAGVAGVGVLNLNDLASALRPAVLPGEEMTVQVVKEGKEPGQGVAYRDDGTMIVIEGGGDFVGKTIAVTVTTVLQTSAGRMIFTKKKGA